MRKPLFVALWIVTTLTPLQAQEPSCRHTGGECCPKNLASWQCVSDGNTCAYIADSKDGQWVCLNDEPTKPYSLIWDLKLSPDAKHLAYIAVEDCVYVLGGGTKGECTYIKVVDGEESDKHHYIQDLTFSPDSQHVAYSASDDCKQFLDERGCPEGHRYVVVDNQPGKAYGAIRDLAFSPDSQKIAYIAGADCDWEKTGMKGIIHDACDRYFVVVDDKEQRPFDFIDNTIAFSADGRHVAYLAKDDCEPNWDTGKVRCDGGRAYVVVDNIPREIDDYVTAKKLSFSPDGTLVTFKAWRQKGDATVGTVNDFPVP